MRAVLTPKWIAAHLAVLVIALVLVNLGLWQLRRLDEKKLNNLVGEARFTAQPMDLESLLGAAGDDLDSLQYRRVTVTGTFHPDDEVLIRSQVYRDVDGFDVITPLVEPGGEAVLVNRGWVPLELDQVPVADAAPPVGQVTIEGWVRLTQERPALGPVDPPQGRLTTLNRVDVDRISQQIPYPLDPVSVSVLGDDDQHLPIPAAAPTFDDEGPHLGYAIQWFGFAIVGLVGYASIVRKRLRRSG